MLVQLQKIKKSYGGNPLFEQLELKIGESDKIGLVGANGTGKSTLLKMIAGNESVDEGNISWKKNSRISYLAQLPDTSDQLVQDYLFATFFELNKLQQELTDLEQQMAQSGIDLEKVYVKYGEKQEAFLQAGGYECEKKVARITNGLAIQSLMSQRMSALSGGERTIVALARVLLQEKDMLLLDESTNHLDTKRTQWLENYLQQEEIAYVIVSHDRFFVEK